MSEKRPTPDKVASGKARTPKGAFGRNLIDIFFSEGIKGVAEEVATNVIIPGVKNMLYDAAVKGIGTAVYGRGNARPGAKVSAGDSRIFVSYDKLNEQPKQQKPIESTVYKGLVSEVLFDTRDDALRVREEIFERLEEFGVMSVRDLCSISDIKSDWAKESYGWDIDHIKAEEVEIVHVREGWLLRMPKPRAIM